MLANSGTTMLHNLSDQHPNIQMSSPKESNFFEICKKKYNFKENTVDESYNIYIIYDVLLKLNLETFLYHVSIQKMGMGEFIVRVVRNTADAKIIEQGLRDRFKNMDWHYIRQIA